MIQPSHLYSRSPGSLWVAAALVALSCASGCALVDAFQGDDDGTSPPGAQFTCDQPFDLQRGDAFVIVNTCGQQPRSVDFSCAFGATDIVFRYEPLFATSHAVCVDGLNGPTFDTVVINNECRDPMTTACFGTGGCTSVFLEAKPQFLHVVLEEPSRCGDISIGILEEGFPEDPLD